MLDDWTSVLDMTDEEFYEYMLSAMEEEEYQLDLWSSGYYDE